MSSHPTTFFGPAIICEQFNIEEEQELYSCWTETCTNYKKRYPKGKFCSMCGKEHETKTFYVAVPYDPSILYDLSLEYVGWYADKPTDDYFIGKGISIENDYEEAQHVLSLEEIEKQLNEFKVTYAKDIGALNAIYNGKTKVELVLLNWIG